jgi:hypothetical protein
METIVTSTGFYESTSPTNFIGTYIVSESMGQVTSSYISSVVVQPGVSSFKFTPATSSSFRNYLLFKRNRSIFFSNFLILILSKGNLVSQILIRILLV